MPDIISKVSVKWKLSNVTPVSNLSYNYIALAQQGAVTPVVLKISCDAALIVSEKNALQHFAGSGSVQLLDYFPEQNALLLQQAIPGTTLKDYKDESIEFAIDKYSLVVQSLVQQISPEEKFKHVAYWCKAIDRITDSRVKQIYITKAKELSDYLLSSAEHEYVCHGDLHLDNVIQHGDIWMSIDPKGIKGELAFEAAAFDLPDSTDAKKRVIQMLAERLSLDVSRLTAWFFVRTIIAAQWFIEDGGCPDKALGLAESLYGAL